MTTLGLSNNVFSGTLPSQIGLLIQLTTLYLNANSFSGTIPSQLGLVTTLSTLTLSSNSFSGTLPGSLTSLTSISNFPINYNPCLYGTPLVSVGTAGTTYSTTSTNLGTATPASGCPYATNANDMAAMQSLSSAWRVSPSTRGVTRVSDLTRAESGCEGPV